MNTPDTQLRLNMHILTPDTVPQLLRALSAVAGGPCPRTACPARRYYISSQHLAETGDNEGAPHRQFRGIEWNGVKIYDL